MWWQILNPNDKLDKMAPSKSICTTIKPCLCFNSIEIHWTLKLNKNATCTLHIAHCTLHIAHSTFNIVHCTLYTADLTLFISFMFQCFNAWCLLIINMIFDEKQPIRGRIVWIIINLVCCLYPSWIKSWSEQI